MATLQHMFWLPRANKFQQSNRIFILLKDQPSLWHPEYAVSRAFIRPHFPTHDWTPLNQRGSFHKAFTSFLRTRLHLHGLHFRPAAPLLSLIPSKHVSIYVDVFFSARGSRGK